MKKLIAGNWKMNGSLNEARTLIADIVNGLHGRPELLEVCDFLVCPPFVHISAIRHTLFNSQDVVFGAQDCSAFGNGAYTGDISAEMLKDAGCSHVILGHSERRLHQGETDDLVRAKAEHAHAAGLAAIICVGETEDQRDQGQEQAVVQAQLAGSLPASATAGNTLVAYEPVWAVGTGKTASPEDAGVMHGFIRKWLRASLRDADTLRILYGGSMKPENAGGLLALPDIDGGLIGGASLSAASFLGIAKAARKGL